MFSKPKKINLRLLISLIILLAIFIGTSLILWESENKVSDNPIIVEAAKDLNSYEIYIDFDPDSKSLECRQRVEYKNRSKDDLESLYFHLYPNAFKYEDKPVFPAELMGRAYPAGNFTSAYLEMDNLKVNDDPGDYIILGFSEDLLMIDLDEILAPGDTAIVDMTYRVQLAECYGRFGYDDISYRIGNCYPIACVYGDSGWSLHRYYDIGDPFYSDMANYKVVVKAPKEYTIASTGDVVKRKKKGKQALTEIRAQAVRDFAWLASDSFKLSSKKLGDTTVNSYFYTGQGKEALDFAVAALKAYNDAFGQYPYNQLSVVQTNFFIGGMEYPNLVMIDGDMYSSSRLDSLEYIIAHELAHQWWYGLVGNDQVMEPWIDEGLTEYSTILYYGLVSTSYTEDQVIDMVQYNKYKAAQARSPYLYPEIDETIDRPVYEFEDWETYDLLVYGKAALMFHGIRETIGDDLFFDVLKEYYKEYRFLNVNKDDIVGVFNRVTGRDFGPYFDQWLYD